MDDVTHRRLLKTITGILLLGATAACGGDADEGDADDEATSPTTPAQTETTPPVGTEPTCEDGTLADRSFILCTAGDTADQDLVVALHGRGSSAREMRSGTGLDHIAAGEGLAVVFPDGIEGGWSDDTFTMPTRPAGDEDVTFLDDLIGQLRTDPRIADGGTVGVVGFSNGASMALRYAVERPDDVRAVVAVAGQLPRDPAIRPTRPVPLLEVYGTADPVRGYDTGIPDAPDRQPGDPTPTLPTGETVAAFVGAAGSPAPEGPEETDPDPDDGTRLRTERWTGDDGTVVVLHSIVDGGHTWPSSPAGDQPCGVVSRDLDASAAAIAFVLDPSTG